MSKRDDLEAAVRSRPDPDTLAVYADFLQAAGDPRGELIALDLRQAPESDRRRGQLLRAWLGDDVELHWDPRQQVWYLGDLEGTNATFDRGFIDLWITGEDDAAARTLLESPAGEHLRRLSMLGTTRSLVPVLERLATRPRRWLQQLAITRPIAEQSLLVDAVLGDRLVAATPNLEVLDLNGGRLVDQLVHRNIRELMVTGRDAIDLDTGEPLPLLHTLDFLFLESDRVPATKFLAPARLPGVRRLRLGRNEPGPDRVFASLGLIAIGPQLTDLELPSLRTSHVRQIAQAAIDGMPALREVRIARSYACLPRDGAELRHASARVVVPEELAWPPGDTVLYRELVIDGDGIDASEIIHTIEDQYEILSSDVRDIWRRFFQVLGDPRSGDERLFAVAELVHGLDELVLQPALRSLHDRLRARLAHRPGGYFATVHWAS